jgi:glyceraldehyde-3-phosphate dehydrogenase (NADP+)
MPGPPSPFYLAGEWRNASPHEQPLEIRNPFNDNLLGTVALASTPDLRLAVERATAAFAKTKASHGYERYEFLNAISAGLREQKEEIAALIAAEVGKPLSAARLEVERSITTFQLAAEEVRRFGGEVVPLDTTRAGQDKFGVVRRFPRGVVLAITPFNFPLNLVAHKVAPALATGNTVILKPSPQGTLTSLRLASIIDSTSLPKGAFSVIPCRNEFAEQLVSDPRIAMLSFTGSPAVGWMLKSTAGRKKVVLELGGNAGVIVDRSADLSLAVSKCIAGSYVYAGQVCIKVQRIYVHDELFDEFQRRFVRAAQDLVSGDPSREDVFVGPVINKEARERILTWIDEAKSKGASLLVGGTHEGNVIHPTALVNVPRESKVFCSEVFGPVATLHRFKSFQEAIECVNDSEFGLQAGVFSNDYSNILLAYSKLDVGAVIVNDIPAFRVDNMPYGGIKSSGFGREGVRYAMEEMTEPKLLALGG